jgi:flagellar protein FlaG
MATSIDGYPGAPGMKPVVVKVHGPNEQSSTSSKADEASARPQPALDPQKVSEATRRVEQLFQTVRRNLEFREDTSSGRMIVSVVDAESGEVIRQLPPEHMVRMAAHLEQMNGLLLGERA